MIGPTCDSQEGKPLRRREVTQVSLIFTRDSRVSFYFFGILRRKSALCEWPSITFHQIR